MHVRGRPDILRCALREIFFGSQLRSIYRKVARYESYFVVGGDYWLVFVDEGISVQQFLYAVIWADTTAILEPSLIWEKMRTTNDGLDTMKSLLYQVIEGVAELHDLGIVHRDIKPSNILVNADQTNKDVTVLIADFSSSISDECLASQLYGKKVDDDHYEFHPSQAEETLQYAPPEVNLCNDCSSSHYTFAYDIYSVGVLFLEFILGTADIFVADQRTQAMIHHKLRQHEGATMKNTISGDEGKVLSYMSKFKELSYRAALAEFCIYNEVFDIEPSISMNVHNQIIKLCGLKDLEHAIQRRDPLGIGFHDQHGLDLLEKLLKWNPSERISMQDALLHPYFTEGSWTFTKTKTPTRSQRSFKGVVTKFTIENMYYFINEPVQELMSSQCSTSGTARYLKLGTSSWYNNLPLLSAPTGYSHSPGSEQQGILTVNEDTEGVVFYCKCGRSFKNWHDCNAHTRGRKHGTRCIYHSDYRTLIAPGKLDDEVIFVLGQNEEHLPKCVSEHSFLPLDRHSGWCDLQGRRATIEDSHAILFSDPSVLSKATLHSFRFFAVLDGHFGNRASHFATSYLPYTFESLLNSPLGRRSSFSQLVFNDNILLTDPWLQSISIPVGTNISLSTKNYLSSDHAVWSIYESFISTNIEFLRRSNPREKAGTTATVVILLGLNPSNPEHFAPVYNYLLVAHVGDSRAVLCCKSEEGRVFALTTDHTLKVATERRRVASKGGVFNMSETTPRVNGKLVVTRSLGGTKSLRRALSAIPDILLIRLNSFANGTDVKNKSPCGRYFLTRSRITREHLKVFKFVISASDGLWDVFDNQEAVDYVCEYLETVLSENNELPLGAFHNAARSLSTEAFMRGSTDNIGVCIVDVLS